jgi:alpha-amylase
MEFDAIWISPIVDNYDGGYHGNWGRDLSKLNYHFGSEQDFAAFITACHERGIWVMADVVASHTGNTIQTYTADVPFSSL